MLIRDQVPSDEELEAMVRDLQRRITKWVRARHQGPDFGFKTFEAHYSNDEPQEPPVALVMWHESISLAKEIEGRFEDFFGMVLDTTPFEAAPYNYTTLYFYPKELPLQEAYARYYRFRWTCSLLQAEFSEAHDELFAFFSKHPEKLADIHWRGFEKLLDAIFKNNGFRTVIGPGRGDGGVDLRLYHHDAVSQLLTLVQAKRYHPKNPITVDAVRSFAQVVSDEKANRGLFVTTARYLPSTKEFAKTRLTQICLAESGDVAFWCANAAHYLNYSRLPESFRSAVGLYRQRQPSTALVGDSSLVGRILVATKPYYGLYNYFSIVISETKSGVLAVMLRSAREGDSVGKETPIIPDAISETPGRDIFNPEDKRPFWAWRRSDHFWGNQQLWHVWSGTPMAYDWND